MKYQNFLKVVIVAAVAAAIGGGAVFYLKALREIMIPHVVTGPETVRVLVAKQALSYGATLQPENLKWVEWPKATVPPGAFTSVEDLLGENGDRRRIVLRSIEPGEPVLEGKITKFGESPRMPMNLGAGMRAVSIKIDAVSGVAGFVAAGDRVDILLTRTLEGQLVSSVILQNITIIAIDASANAESSSPRLERTVTVAVDTDQAQKLALARQVGKLSLTLRGIGEARDKYGRPPLHVAAQSGTPAAIAALVSAGAEVNARDKYGRTPLHVAAWSGTPTNIAALVSAGAEVNARNKDGETALHSAARSRTPANIASLVSAGAEVDARHWDGSTPLHSAAVSRTPDNIAALVSAGADVEARDKDGWTPLHYAALGGTPDNIAALLEAGASGSVKDKYGSTPFDLAGGNDKIKGTDAYRALKDAQYE
jgi:pilus assembly protein CpaB